MGWCWGCGPSCPLALCVLLAPPFLQPFVDAKNDMQQYFPERKWAILIPTILLVGAISVAGTFIGSVMMKSGKRN